MTCRRDHDDRMGHNDRLARNSRMVMMIVSSIVAASSMLTHASYGRCFTDDRNQQIAAATSHTTLVA
ncbi:hypothetical protein KIH86_07385 [Paenibacillus sp. HN-1]|uniref:hypothetical protein n=1 Tax=Paenibacillus TaxID=44249 RepID=UPI001CA9D06F|nr:MULTISPECIES: hypothetical protein [Paenibacillus]MBY9080482.1 hypothetical protein [Paenibacillus sp. CGMCC 1.18879]MBY9084062.1 hypothetical protein [Paenibacillus sinensis]